MKAKKKRKNLEEEEEKMERKEGEERKKNGGDDGQEKPGKAKKPKKNWFLARLQKTWVRIAGPKRRRTSIQEERSSEELPGPSHINMVDSTANMSSKEKDKEENQSITADDKEAVLEKHSFVDREILSDYQLIHDLIHSMEDMYIQYYGGQDGKQQYEGEILAEYQQIQDLIHSMEGLFIQYYGGQDGQHHNGGEEELESKVGDDGEVKINEDGEKGLENPEKAKKSRKILFLDCLQKSWARIAGLKWRRTNRMKEQRSSCEIPGPSQISSRGTKTSQSSSRHDQKSTSDISLDEPDQSGEEISATVALSLESFAFHRTLGAGSFGQVFMARDIIRKECVAIKVSDKRDFTEQGYSFIERHVLQLSHESHYLIHGLAAFHTLNFVYYVMELATRGDLLNFISKNFPLDTATIQCISAEVVCGTEFLHKKGILHRDLKPENILLTTDGHVKITDFGLAVMGVYQKHNKDCIGTPGYAAPELVKCQTHGRGVDYFAIGVILYKLYTSKLPFPGKHPREIHHSVLHHDPVYPETLTPDTVNILQGLLCKDRLQRLGVNGDIKNHPFFSDINWEDVEARRMAPPAILMAASDDQNINQTLDYAEMPNRIRSRDQKIFNKFSFVCPEWSAQYHPVIIQTKTWMAKVFTRRPFRKKEK